MKANLCRLLSGTCALAALGALGNLQAQTATSLGNVATNSVPPAGSAPGHAHVAPLNGKLYVGFDAGVAWQKDITLSDGLGGSEQIKFDPGARLDVEVGYDFTKNWAAELEFGVIMSSVQSSRALGTDYMSVYLTELPLLVNGIYTQPLGKRCSVYIGGGVGGVFAYYENEYWDTTPTAVTFAYQGMAGIRFLLSQNCELGLGYKYLATNGYDVGSGIAYNSFVPTEFKSDGNQTQSVLLTCTLRF